MSMLDCYLIYHQTPTQEMERWIHDNIKPNFRESSDGELIFSMYVPNADMETFERLAGDRLPAISAQVQKFTQYVFGGFMADPYISSQIASIKGCDANDNKVAMLNDLLNSYPARIYLLAARMYLLETSQDDVMEHINNHTERKDESYNG